MPTHSRTASAPMPLVSFLDPRPALLAALGDDVGGAERPGDRLAGLVTRHRDDALGSQVGGGQHPAEADGAVADDDRRAARLHTRRHGRVPAGGHHVGQGQQRRDQVGVRHPGRLDEAALGLVDLGVLRLAALGEAEVVAHGVHPDQAVRAGVVGVAERDDDEVAGLERGDGGADLLDDADGLVADGVAGGDVVLAAVRPQVGAADAAGDHLDDRVGVGLDPRVRNVGEADVAGIVDRGCSHGAILAALVGARTHGAPRPPRDRAGRVDVVLSHI